MLTKPDLTDEEIIECLNNAYGLDVDKICFLPLGNSFNTSVYRITTSYKEDYFLKLRRGNFFEASVKVPKYLADLGIKQVIPPLSTKKGQLWTNIVSFKAILYPYVEGRNSVDAKLSAQQWGQFGSTMKKFHSTDVPAIITRDIPKEIFSIECCVSVKTFLKRIQNEIFEEHVAMKMAMFLKSKNTEILKLIEQTEALADNLQTQALEYVLCHADIHGWNLMVEAEGALYIVDWDTLIFAPKERDLMFIGAGLSDSGHSLIKEEVLFYQGYGQTEINHDLINYYRYARIIQDIGEYCERIFLSAEGGEDRIQSFDYLQSIFLPDGPLETAYKSDKARK